MNRKTIKEQVDELVNAKFQLEMLLRKIQEELVSFVADWDSNDPAALPLERVKQINPVRRLLEFAAPAFEQSKKFSYTKEELTSAIAYIIGVDQVEELGLPKATEEAAVQLFLQGSPDSDDSLVVREAISDLRQNGYFQFAATNNEVSGK